jgi:acyl dehydratase
MTEPSGASSAADIDVAQLSSWIGREVVSPWQEVSQAAITQFADVTGDRQWIHIDGDRATR